LAPVIEFYIFRSLGGLPSPIFGSVSGDLTLPSKWGCDNLTDEEEDLIFETKSKLLSIGTIIILDETF
jgi:hypothetical protein